MSFALALLMAAAIQPDMIVSTEWLAENLDDPNVIVLEIGVWTDFEVGDKSFSKVYHIPGAHFMPRHELLATRNGVPDELPPIEALEKSFGRAGVGNHGRIVIYSRDPLLATRAWFTLDYLGHGDRAAILNGGIAKWRAEGRKVEPTRYGYAAVRFTASIEPDKLITQSDMKTAMLTGNYNGKPVTILDARPPYQYIGRKSGRDVDRAGHIPEAECFPWTANLTTTQPRTFRDDVALEQMYAAAGATKDVKVLLYCRTGVEASMNYFILRHLGYDVVLYDGSYVEWTRSADNPVAMASR